MASRRKYYARPFHVASVESGDVASRIRYESVISRNASGGYRFLSFSVAFARATATRGVKRDGTGNDDVGKGLRE